MSKLNETVTHIDSLLLTNDNSIPPNYSLKPTLMQVYYPFGEVRWQMDDLANENKNNQNWIGKEKDKENGLGDHGVRKYEYETGRFTSIDPLWNNYYGWTPYQYSLNSPIELVDFDGKKVFAMDDVSRENIINSVESKYRNLIKFKDDGEVYLDFTDDHHNLAPLKRDLSNVTNITALEYLIKSDEIIEISESTFAHLVDAGDFKKFDLDWYINDKLYRGANGITLVKYDPTITVTSQRTDVNQIVISPNQFKSLTEGVPATKASTTAHELYGHMLLYLFQMEYKGHIGKVGEFIKGAEERSRQ